MAKYHWCGAECDGPKCKAVKQHMIQRIPNKHDAVAIVPSENHHADPARYVFAYRARHDHPPVPEGLIGREVFKTDGYLVPDGVGDLDVPDRRIKRKAVDEPLLARGGRGRGRGAG